MDVTDQSSVEEHLKTQIAGNPDLPDLTYQESHFVAIVASGISVPVAAARSGITPTTGYNWLKREDINSYLCHLKEQRLQELSAEVKYTLEDAHLDIEHGKRMAANSMEYLRGVDMQIKLHELGGEGKRANQPSIQVNIANVQKAEQLEVLSDEDLLQLAGDSLDRLQPENG